VHKEEEELHKATNKMTIS